MLELPVLAEQLDLGYKRGDTKVLGLSNWKMKLLGYKMGKTRKEDPALWGKIKN